MSDFVEKLKENLKEETETLKENVEKIWSEAKDAFEDNARKSSQALESRQDLFAWADGSLLSAAPQGPLSKNHTGMYPLASMVIKDQNLISPCDGIITAVEPEENTIFLKMTSGLEIALKVCVGAISFKTLAHVLVAPNQKVTAGQILVHFEIPIEAKSKIFLVNPDEQTAKNNPFLLTKKDEPVHRGDLLLSTRS